MLWRPTPTCEFCNEVVAEAVYHDRSDGNNTFFGDTFSHWKRDLNHTCEGSREFWRNLKHETQVFNGMRE